MLSVLWWLFGQSVQADEPSSHPTAAAVASVPVTYDRCQLAFIVSADRKRVLFFKVHGEDGDPDQGEVVRGVPYQLGELVGSLFRVPYKHYLTNVVVMPTGLYGQVILPNSQFDVIGSYLDAGSGYIHTSKGVDGPVMIINARTEGCREKGE